jgi:hypothetical protein
VGMFRSAAVTCEMFVGKTIAFYVPGPNGDEEPYDAWDAMSTHSQTLKKQTSIEQEPVSMPMIG